MYIYILLHKKMRISGDIPIKCKRPNNIKGNDKHTSNITKVWCNGMKTLTMQQNILGDSRHKSF